MGKSGSDLIVLLVFAVSLGYLICWGVPAPQGQSFSLVSTTQGQVGMIVGALASLILAITVLSNWPGKPIFKFISFITIVCGLAVGGLMGRGIVGRRLNPFKVYAYHWRSLSTPASEPYVRGKVITIVEKDGASLVDPLFMELPNELQPSTPDEVGTIAQFYCDSIVVGRYHSAQDGSQNQGAARQQRCKIALFERPSGDLIDRQILYGGEPPPSITVRVKPGETSSGGATGSSPRAQLVEYLSSLPRR